MRVKNLPTLAIVSDAQLKAEGQAQQAAHQVQSQLRQIAQSPVFEVLQKLMATQQKIIDKNAMGFVAPSWTEISWGV